MHDCSFVWPILTMDPLFMVTPVEDVTFKIVRSFAVELPLPVATYQSIVHGRSKMHILFYLRHV